MSSRATMVLHASPAKRQGVSADELHVKAAKMLQALRGNEGSKNWLLRNALHLVRQVRRSS